MAKAAAPSSPRAGVVDTAVPRRAGDWTLSASPPKRSERLGPPAGSLDFAILRESSGRGFAGFGFDPRRSPELIAKRLGVSPATVRRRLATWREEGFLLGFNVLPHPALLGGWLAARVLDFANPVAQTRAIEALGLMDGVIEIDPARNSLLVAYFLESPAQSDRRLRQLRAIEGASRIGPEMTFDFPECSRRMSRTDWRLTLALRRRPDATLTQLADDVGQSVRTTSRRFDSLLDAGALMFDPIFEFSRFPQTLAVLRVELDSPELRDSTASAVRELHTESLPTWGLQPSGLQGGVANLHLWVTARTAAELDGVAARVAHLPGVRDASLWYGRATIPIQSWLDERIATVLRISEMEGPATTGR